MKLYTKTGDKGTSSLYRGGRLDKNNIVFHVLGDLDELSSHIGLLLSLCNHQGMINPLREIQLNLHDIGAVIATINHHRRIKPFNPNHINTIESLIDYCEKDNTRLTEFILPGMSFPDAQSQVCRAVTRRLERNMWSMHNSFCVINSDITIYINRLSDFFFAYGRWLCKAFGYDDYRVSYLNTKDNEEKDEENKEHPE